MKELTFKQKSDLANIFHTSKVLYSKLYDRLIYSTKEFNKIYPQISTTCAYKHLTRMMEWRY